MINTNELRRGNWVNATYDGIDYRQVFSIPNMDEFAAEPITITPEILEKAGFKKEDKLNVNAQTWCKFGMGEYLTYYFDGFCKFEFGIKPAIKYVHQLQNLYFALTGEELYIKL